MNSFPGQFVSAYAIHLAIMIAIYLLLAQSLNVTLGLGRLFNLAHVSSYALGAYTTALLATKAGASFGACILAAMVVSGLFSFLLGAIALRLSSDYFAVGTLAFSAIVAAVLVNWRSVTNGVLGIPGIPRPEFGGIDFDANGNFLILAATCALVMNVGLLILAKGRFGRILRGAAEYEHAALALGHNVRRTRGWAFFIASTIAGLAGALFAYYLNYIDPSSFSLTEMVFILTIVVVGRPGSFSGVALGTACLILLPEALRFIEISSAYLGPARQLLYAAILFGVVAARRNHLFSPTREV